MRSSPLNSPKSAANSSLNTRFPNKFFTGLLFSDSSTLTYGYHDQPHVLSSASAFKAEYEQGGFLDMTRRKSAATNGNGRGKHLQILSPTPGHANGKSKPILITGGAGFV